MLTGFHLQPRSPALITKSVAWRYLDPVSRLMQGEGLSAQPTQAASSETSQVSVPPGTGLVDLILCWGKLRLTVVRLGREEGLAARRVWRLS